MTALAVTARAEAGAQLRTYATLLPLNIHDLDGAIVREAADNPWLELLDRPVLGLFDGEFGAAPGRPSLGEHLTLALEARNLTGPGMRAARFVIGSLDEHGYLREDTAQIARLAHVTVTDAERAVSEVQALEPIGCAARSLGERFRLQLAAADAAESLAYRLTFDLEALAAEGRAAFARRHGLAYDELACALARLRSCDPHPARDFSASVEHVYPEIVIARAGDVVTASVDRRFWPDVRLASLDAGAGLSQAMRDARSRARLVVDALTRRHTTLERLAGVLAERQAAYFLADGDVRALVPLSGREVARDVGCAESTVSRAIAGRYAATPFGTIPLRELIVRRPGGSGLTVAAVHDHIRDIAGSLPQISDDAIARALRLRGIRLARRTVAKYRHELGLASSRRSGRR